MGKGERVPREFSHACLKDLLTFGMCLAAFPLDGIRGPDPSGLKFKWFSSRAVYTYTILAGVSLCCLVFGERSLSSEMILHDLITPLFYFHLSGNILVSIKIARAWPRFMSELHEEEKLFLKKYKPVNKLRWKINAVAGVATLLLAVEHLLGYMTWYSRGTCKGDPSGLEYVMKRQFLVLYKIFGYNPILTIYFLVLSFVGTFIWNFGDLIIVSLSIVLTTRFEQISQKMRWFVTWTTVHHIEIGKMELNFWKEVRRDYNIVCKMCDKINVMISDAILLSYACNLCFVLLQIFISLKQRERTIEVMYFFATFGFVVMRIVVVSVYGGWLNEAARAPLVVLNAIPTENYNHQITGIISQIQTVNPTLTGRNFFSINKGLVLSIAATIISYELILIQFSQSSLDKYLAKDNITECL